MGPQAKHRKVFKRLETDDELRGRLIDAGIERYKVAGVSGAELDDVGWKEKKMQRKIVDGVE